MKVFGPRPEVEPIHRGEFESLVVYLRGDVVTWGGIEYEAQDDFRSGFLDPPTVIQDTEDLFWKIK